MPTLGDAELLTLAVMSALLGSTSERRWLRYADGYLAGMFPRRIGQSGYNERMRKASALFIRVIRMLAMDTTLWSDDVWVVDSTPVECGRSRETARRSDAAGWAEYGYCASHSRYFWGLRLHLVCTLGGLPVLFAVAGANAQGHSQGRTSSLRCGRYTLTLIFHGKTRHLSGGREKSRGNRKRRHGRVLPWVSERSGAWLAAVLCSGALAKMHSLTWLDCGAGSAWGHATAATARQPAQAEQEDPRLSPRQSRREEPR